MSSVEERISYAKRVAGLSGSPHERARQLYLEAQKGPYVSPAFYFELVVECLRSVGLELKQKGQFEVEL